VAFEKKKPSPEEARAKIRTFCNYRERSHREVKEKLYSMGLYSKEVDQLLVQMMDENLLNEERYARSYARGRFRLKKWGWVKIEQGLRQQGIHQNLLKMAKSEIDEQEYMDMLQSMANKKWAEHSKDQYMIRKAKVYRFLIGRGFESSLINSVLKSYHSPK